MSKLNNAPQNPPMHTTTGNRTEANPILPWHDDTAVAIMHSDYTTIHDIAVIIAAHDPHAAQQQETVRLLKETLAYVAECAEREYAGARELRDEIRAHLATLRGEKGTK